MTALAPKLSRLGRAALIYAAEHGWRVFPLHSIVDGRCSCGAETCTGTKPGKHPRTTRGCLDATTDLSQIRIWWTQWPEANVGIATGNGLIVIDIDPRHGGDDGFDDLKARLGPLPETVEACTGSGGRHVYLSVPEGVTVRNSASQLAPGVDVRGEGGYVVAAPSTHVSGRVYGWELSSRPGEVDVAPAPQAWLDALTRKPKLRVLAGGNGGDIVEGSRNETLFKRGCSMRAAGFDEPAITAALLSENDSRCNPPLDPAEVKSIAASAARYQPGLSPEFAAKQRKAVALPEAPAEEATPVVDDDGEWMQRLAQTKDGKLRATFANVCAVLRHDKRYASLAQNAMTRAPELDGQRVTDARLARIREEIEIEYAFTPSADQVASAVLLVGTERERHPVREYLRSLTWDGVERLDHVASTILGAEPTPINQVMLRSWFVSAVARAIEPGCKVDTSLVLVGGQGAGKSSFFRVLGGQWFSDSGVDIESKDAMLQINSAWIYELGELDHVTSRAHAGRIKAFITSQRDSFRPPYGRVIETVPRHNVIVGSTNETQFLQDSTGDRRFWVVRVGQIDLDALHRDRDQLWAEALAAHQRREGWWLEQAAETARTEATEEHRVADVWEDAVAAWLATLPAHESRDITTQRVLQAACRVELERCDHRASARVGAILRRLGWTQRVVRVDGRNTRVWDVQEPDGAWRHRP